MQLKTQEHADLIAQFEREFRGRRLDREAKELWPRERIYQDGQVNELFVAYRRGYALGRSVYIGLSPAAGRGNDAGEQATHPASADHET